MGDFHVTILITAPGIDAPQNVAASTPRTATASIGVSCTVRNRRSDGAAAARRLSTDC